MEEKGARPLPFLLSVTAYEGRKEGGSERLVPIPPRRKTAIKRATTISRDITKGLASIATTDALPVLIKGRAGCNSLVSSCSSVDDGSQCFPPFPLSVLLSLSLSSLSRLVALLVFAGKYFEALGGTHNMRRLRAIPNTPRFYPPPAFLSPRNGNDRRRGVTRHG